MNPPSCTISGDKYAAGSRLHRIGCWIRDSRPVDSPFETKLFLLGPGQAPGGVPRNEVRATATAHHLGHSTLRVGGDHAISDAVQGDIQLLALLSFVGLACFGSAPCLVQTFGQKANERAREEKKE
jgi:hypothetical protein